MPLWRPSQKQSIARPGQLAEPANTSRAEKFDTKSYETICVFDQLDQIIAPRSRRRDRDRHGTLRCNPCRPSLPASPYASRGCGCYIRCATERRRRRSFGAAISCRPIAGRASARAPKTSSRRHVLKSRKNEIRLLIFKRRASRRAVEDTMLLSMLMRPHRSWMDVLSEKHLATSRSSASGGSGRSFIGLPACHRQGHEYSAEDADALASVAV